MIRNDIQSPYKHRRAYFIAVVALQMVLLAGMSVAPAFRLTQARLATFTTAPVDPWDMFRGDYISLAYDFSQNVPVHEEFKTNDTIYVVLQSGGNGKWTAVRSKHLKPAVSADELVIKGKVDSAYDGLATVHYGIERLYVPERQGRDVSSSDQLEIDAAIGDDGTTIIKEARYKQRILYHLKLI